MAPPAWGECPKSFAPLQPLDYRSPNRTQPAKNIILMIGDGMGPLQLAAAFPRNDSSFSEFKFKGTLTHCSLTGVTDSAAAATSMATGKKTHNGMLAYSPNERKIKTILEIAQKDFGKATGLVTTTEITHATPAAFASHVRDRKEAKTIAKHYLRKTKPHLLFGGGEKYFAALGLPLEVNTRLWKGYWVIRHASELPHVSTDALPSEKRILGLFNSGHLTWDIERLRQGVEKTQPSLAEMTAHALDFLSKEEKGFFLMVEGGRIDHAAHGNDLEKMIGEVKAFNAAGAIALDFARRNPNTLVIVTADHETGGLRKTKKGYQFTTRYHTATPVPIFAEGPNADALPATESDQRIVFHLMHQAILP